MKSLERKWKQPTEKNVKYGEEREAWEVYIQKSGFGKALEKHVKHTKDKYRQRNEAVGTADTIKRDWVWFRDVYFNLSTCSTFFFKVCFIRCDELTATTLFNRCRCWFYSLPFSLMDWNEDYNTCFKNNNKLVDWISCSLYF